MAVWAEDAAIGHEEHGVGGWLGFVVAFDREPGGGTQCVRLVEADTHVVAQLDELIVCKDGRRGDFAAVDEGALQGLQNVGAGVAADDCVATRQIGQDRQRDRIAGRWLADGDYVVEANEEAADGIDPQQSSIGFF